MWRTWCSESISSARAAYGCRMEAGESLYRPRNPYPPQPRQHLVPDGNPVQTGCTSRLIIPLVAQSLYAGSSLGAYSRWTGLSSATGSRFAIEMGWNVVAAESCCPERHGGSPCAPPPIARQVRRLRRLQQQRKVINRETTATVRRDRRYLSRRGAH
jgi:hypothetical protein